MASQEVMGWPVEDIPDTACLFLRLHIESLRPTGQLHPGVFRAHGGGMSTDWDKYSTPEEARGRAREPERNGVVTLIAGLVRKISGLAVKHSPDWDRQNRAHTDVLGMEGPAKVMARIELFNQVRERGWEIPPGPAPL